ncbi:MAG: HIRAN domain-containing protein [Oscillospiraceae bacterium]
MNKTRSKVMIMANSLVKHGISRRTAMLKAWIIAKASALRTKIKGTSRRQSELEKLSALNPSEIRVQLKREPHNSHDSNAIAVYAALTNRRVSLSVICRKP